MGKRVLPNDVMLDEVARLLDEGREVVIIPKGMSMLPFIRGGIDKVTLRKPSDLSVGDIVLVKFNGVYILHRIIGIEGEHITLMGDGNLQGTESGTRSEVIGIVSEIITPQGRIFQVTKGRLWRKLLPVRRYLLKGYRKGYRLFGKQFDKQ